MLRWESDELACKICGKTEDEINDIINNDKVDDMLMERYDDQIDSNLFYRIVEDLLPLTPIVETALTGDKYHAFIDHKEETIIVRLKVGN